MKSSNFIAWCGAGFLFGLAGAVVASTVTIPHTFTSGTPAKAAEVNANFNAVKTSVNDNAARILDLEKATGIVAVQELTVTPLDPVPGETVTIRGKDFTILQAEIPKLDSDEIYVLRFPSSGASASIFVNANYEGAPSSTERTNLVAEIDGFSVRIFEKQNYSQSVSIGSFSEELSQSIGVNIQLGEHQAVSILSSLQFTRSTASGPMPIVESEAARELVRQDLRELLRYIRITKKSA